jgi:alpha-beta hydrolase superfamily lysophospholipase
VSKSKNGARLSTTSAPLGPAAAVLVLHGGTADSTTRVAPTSLAVLWMVPVARAVARAVPSAAVYRLRFSVRGWNSDGAEVLRDARWAVGQIAADHPGLPIVVVGHSLGGRVAMHLAGTTPGVVGAVGLAPWVEPGDPVDGLGGVPLVVIHGTRDRIVPETSTRAWLAKAGQAGARVESTLIEGGGHAMFRYLRRWHRLTGDGVQSVLVAADHPAART